MGKGEAETSRYGKYLLQDKIGRGGMSEVFLAKTEGIEGFERKVALKRIFPSLTENREFVRNFIEEARVGGMLYHHNVVQTLDFGSCDDTYYIALEYIEGTHLGNLLNSCRQQNTFLPPGVFLQISLQICEGLEYIHQASVDERSLNLVHRDIKPSNMLITSQGLVKISDFGVVKAESRGGDRTTVGSIKGTVGYMSPEQARAETVGPTSDLYSLGAMLFEMATLKRLYGEGDAMTILQRVRDSDFQVPVSLVEEYIPGLEALLTRMMAPTPADRYPGARDVTHALKALRIPASDRGSLVAFVKSLGLLDRAYADGQNSGKKVEEQPTEQGSGEDSRPEPAGFEPPSPLLTPAGAAGSHARKWQAPLFALIVALLGLAAALGSYQLVDDYLTRHPLSHVRTGTSSAPR